MRAYTFIMVAEVFTFESNIQSGLLHFCTLTLRLPRFLPSILYISDNL